MTRNSIDRYSVFNNQLSPFHCSFAEGIFHACLSTRQLVWLAAITTVAILVGCSNQSNLSDDAGSNTTILRPSADMTRAESQVLSINVNEELVLELQPKFRLFEAHLKANANRLEDILADEIEYVGPSSIFDFANHLPNQRISLKNDFTKLSAKAGDFAQLFWSPILNSLRFEDTQFGNISGRLADDDDRFEMKVAFEGRGETKDSRKVAVEAKQKVVWRHQNGQWRICQWKQLAFDITWASKPLFSDATSKLIRDKETLDLVKRSRHEATLVQRASHRGLFANFDPVFQVFTDWNSLFQYPGVSVVDFDNDGLEDLFLTNRFDENCLLRNRGDGTFIDATQFAGLQLEQSMSNCSVFADFDNDGDQDLLLCRTFQPAIFYRNNGGRFRPDPIVNRNFNFIRFVSAASVVDVNRDGLLDVYLSTYATKAGSDFRWIQYVVHPNKQQRLYDEITTSHSFLNRKGPPNILLINEGGALKPINQNSPLDQWRNSYQSVWLDYDDDGDSDLYVCNDFAPDALLRNDTPKGEMKMPVFVDVTETAFNGNSMGFGMGASVGDYDNDGDLDLYVSNMYSKAGQRIVNSIDGKVDPRITVSTQGNFLYQNSEGRFRNVAGMHSGDQLVAKVGWSFGGQFGDFNNDSHLDLYVPSGFFTAPESIAEDVDL